MRIEDYGRDDELADLEDQLETEKVLGAMLIVLFLFTIAFFGFLLFRTHHQVYEMAASQARIESRIKQDSYEMDIANEKLDTIWQHVAEVAK